MATETSENKLSIKLVIDKEENKVLFAECDKNFVDILLSFLTMPLGTIIRLLNKQQQPVAIGSLTSLYKGVANLDNKHFWTEACKTMLLYPINNADRLCRKLKLCIDDTPPTSYFIGNCKCRRGLTYFSNVSCSCGGKLDIGKSVRDVIANDKAAEGKGVFLDSEANFIITDDLQITPGTSMFVCDVFKAIPNTNVLHTTTVNVGLLEVSNILHQSFLSNSPLTKVFLSDVMKLSSNTSESNRKPMKQLLSRGESSSNCTDMKLKVMIRNSDKRILYAEATEEFVDEIFSFLTFPLGSVMELCSCQSSLSCIENLRKSVRALKNDEFIKSERQETMLLSPRLPPKFQSRNQFLGVKEVDCTPYYHRSITPFSWHFLTFEKYSESGYESLPLTFIDPKLPLGDVSEGKGYVKGPARFMVSDDLTVSLLSPSDIIGLLQKLSITASDLEEQVISIGKEEVLSILKASLISASALTTGLYSGLHESNQEHDA